ncbi:putative cyclin-D6-1 [Arachis duranensis]|uniref:B-like cyclin n=1 Tax=Arachis duranensis TaxID=130453 RepID=A0A6P4BJT2_ARADU|nr:putative cyclin-D6-1 [Arachis duranensis]XP_052111819.1 putative cyclin-D6-1 [Arachis duranensis]XP_052111820.1 putative cyclin-D6-1 [Arachis duranensis]
MEFDLEDPLSCFKEQEAYTITELFASESDHMPAPNYLNSTHFRASFRCEAISLILQVQFSCNLDPSVAYLAINYLHRFMSRQEIPMEKPWLLKLVVISCLSLASKMKNTPLSISDIQIEGCIFESQTVGKMELLILGALEWRMRSITPFPFLHFFISSTELKDPSLKQVLKEQATKIIFNAHNDIKLLEYKPSTIAASALISASRELCPQQYTMLRASIAACENLDEDSLTKCIDLMQEMVMWTEANESTIDTSFLSTETPVSVLERSIKRRRI